MEVERFWRSSGVEVIQGYGLTESSPILTCNTFEDYRIGTVGKLIPGVDVTIVDGEIIARGENIFSGYYKNVKETRNVIKDGWLYTGDLGEFDSDGYLKITGRKKNMILSPSGLNVYPEDIEKTLNKLGDVRDSVVLGLDNGRKLVGVILATKKISLGDLLKRANSQLESHQYLHSLILWNGKDFPRTPTLKVKRREVEAGLKLGEKSREESEDLLTDLIAEVCEVSTKKVTDESILSDLGLDSLKRIELGVKIEEKFDIDFNEDEINEKTHVSDLRKLIIDSKNVTVASGLNYFNSKYFVPLRVALQWIFFTLTRPIYSLDVKGLENLKELDSMGRECIFIANHVSMFDTLALLRALPFKYRIRLSVAGAKDFFFRAESKYGRILGTFGRLVLNAFAFARDKEIKQSLKDFGSVINRGGSVLIYPEGTRSPTGRLLEFKQGIGLLTWHMDVPVIPLRSKGLYDVLPRGKVLPKRGKVEVVIGKPLQFNKMKSFIEITKELEKEMRKL